MATAEGINVIPCFFVCERDFIWSETYDVAIPLVKFSLASSELAGQEAVNEGQARGSPQLGSRELSEWMKVQVVNRLGNWILRQSPVS